MKKYLIAGNWKMNKTIAEAAEFTEAIAAKDFKNADEVLEQSVSGITDLINIRSLINLDFADVRTVMLNKGIAHIGIGTATGDGKAEEAVKAAVTSPLLETNIKGASHVIINITGDISLIEANDAATYVQELAGEGANIIFGARYEEEPADTCTITVIATGISDATVKMTTSKASDSRFSANTSSSTEPKSQATSFATAAKPAESAADKDEEKDQIKEIPVKPEPAKPQLNFTTPARAPRQSSASRDITIPDFLKKR